MSFPLWSGVQWGLGLSWKVGEEGPNPSAVGQRAVPLCPPGPLGLGDSGSEAGGLSAWSCPPGPLHLAGEGHVPSVHLGRRGGLVWRLVESCPCLFGGNLEAGMVRGDGTQPRETITPNGAEGGAREAGSGHLKD